MIEKIEMPEMDETYKSAMFAKVLGNKINELCDVVNEQQKQIDKMSCAILDLATPNGENKALESIKAESKTPVAPYAENTQDENPRCPFCGEELYYAQEIDGGFEILTCDCPRGIWLFGNDKMWYNLEKTITELARTRKALDKGMEHITGLNNMIESWYKLLQSDKNTSTKYAILKSAISAYMETKGGDNE